MVEAVEVTVRSVDVVVKVIDRYCCLRRWKDGAQSVSMSADFMLLGDAFVKFGKTVVDQ